MLSKTTIKYVRSLRDRKYRQKYHKIVVEGVKTVRDILTNPLVEIETIYGSPSWMDEIRSASVGNLPPLIQVEEHQLAAMSAFVTPQYVLAICMMPAQTADPAMPITELCLYLDGVRDPGNLGTIFRIADWFGIRNIFVSDDCVDTYNPKVIQASMGSIFSVKWKEITLETLLAQKEMIVYATAPGGENIYTQQLSSQGLIIFGNEALGIRATPAGPNIKKVAIPADFRLGADSLNVAVSAGIICGEFRRRSFNS